MTLQFVRQAAQASRSPLLRQQLASAGQRRTLVVVRNGQTTVRGLKKDEALYMKNPHGIEYPGNAETFAPLQELLSSEYALPEELMLQALTHKSFAHGKKPYNERLAILGKQLLRMETSRATAQSAAQGTQESINGHNFDVNERAIELLSSSPTLSQVCRLAKLEKSIFWRPADTGKGGEATIYSTSLSAVVGAVLLQHGAEKAIEFIRTRLMAGPYSVFDISDQIFVNTA